MLPTDKYPPAYPTLDPEDVRILNEGIVARFCENDLIQLLSYKGWNWDKQIGPGAYKDRVFALVDHLNYVGQLHWLIDLLDQARVNFDTFVRLRALLAPPLPPRQAAVAATPPAVAAGNSTDGAVANGDDPWEMVLLDTDEPFLDRGDFRRICQLVGGAKSKPILSVTGEADTGKSYTASYLSAVSKSMGAGQGVFATKQIRLDRLNGVVEAGASPSIDGLRLARLLAPAITGQDLPGYIASTVGSEQDTTWAVDAAAWMGSNAEQRPVPWIVFDGFDSTVLTPSAQALLNSLIAFVAQDARMRIALLGYPGDLSWCDKVRHAPLGLEDFTDPTMLTQHVITFLLAVREEAKRRRCPHFTNDQLDDDARVVLVGVDPSAPDLHALQGALTAIAERVLVP